MKEILAAVFAVGLAAGGAWAEDEAPGGEPAQEQDGGGFGGGTGKAPAGVTWENLGKIDKSNIKGAVNKKGEPMGPGGDRKACEGCATAKDEAKKLAGAAEGKTAVVQCADCKKYCGVGADGQVHVAKCQDCVKAQVDGGKKCPACQEKQEKKAAKKKAGG